MRLLVAPDKFKDALDAPAVATAIADGWTRALPSTVIDLCPLADGGDGTGSVLADAVGATRHTADVLDPLGRSRRATWWHRADSQECIVEAAQACGLALLARRERNPLRTTSYGVGQLLLAATRHGRRSVLLAVGGTATVDGGAGCLQALGWRLLNRGGREIRAPIPGGALTDIAAIAPPHSAPRLSITVLCDVSNTLLGRAGAAPTFAPQKGATQSDVALLERGLQNWANLLHQHFGVTVAELPGAGAAGGLPAGLHAALTATLANGFDAIAAAVNLPTRVRSSDIILTGEGRFDAQSGAGKVVGGVARLAADLGKPAVALVGSRDRDATSAAGGLTEVIAISDPRLSLDAALAQTGENLRRAAAELAKKWAFPA